MSNKFPPIPDIQNGEEGLSVREKLNAVIDQTNKQWDLDGKLDSHTTDKNNPHSVTAPQVRLDPILSPLRPDEQNVQDALEWLYRYFTNTGSDWHLDKIDGNVTVIQIKRERDTQFPIHPNDLQEAELVLNRDKGQLWTKLIDGTVVKIGDESFITEAPLDGELYGRTVSDTDPTVGMWHRISLATVSEEMPTAPQEGDLWVDTKNTMELYVYLEGQGWISMTGAGGGSGTGDNLTTDNVTGPNVGKLLGRFFGEDGTNIWRPIYTDDVITRGAQPMFRKPNGQFTTRTDIEAVRDQQTANWYLWENINEIKDDYVPVDGGTFTGAIFGPSLVRMGHEDDPHTSRIAGVGAPNILDDKDAEEFIVYLQSAPPRPDPISGHPIINRFKMRLDNAGQFSGSSETCVVFLQYMATNVGTLPSIHVMWMENGTKSYSHNGYSVLYGEAYRSEGLPLLDNAVTIAYHLKNGASPYVTLDMLYKIIGDQSHEGLYVKKLGGDQMQGPLVIQTQTPSDSRATNKVQTLGVFSNSDGSALRLGTTRDRVYVGHNDTSFNGPIKVGEIQEKNNGAGIKIYDEVSMSDKRITELAQPVDQEDAVNLRFLNEKIGEFLGDNSIGKMAYRFTMNPAQGQFCTWTLNGGSSTNVPAQTRQIWAHNFNIDGYPFGWDTHIAGTYLYLTLADQRVIRYRIQSVIDEGDFSKINVAEYEDNGVPLQEFVDGAVFDVGFRTISGGTGDLDDYVAKTGDVMTGKLETPNLSVKDVTPGTMAPVLIEGWVDGVSASARILMSNKQYANAYGAIEWHGRDEHGWFSFDKDIDMGTYGLHSVGRLRMKGTRKIQEDTVDRISFDNRTIINRASNDNATGFEIKGRTEEGPNGKLLAVYHNSTGKDAVNYYGKQDSNTNIITRGTIEDELKKIRDEIDQARFMTVLYSSPFKTRGGNPKHTLFYSSNAATNPGANQISGFYNDGTGNQTFSNQYPGNWNIQIKIGSGVLCSTSQGEDLDLPLGYDQEWTGTISIMTIEQDVVDNKVKPELVYKNSIGRIRRASSNGIIYIYMGTDTERSSRHNPIFARGNVNGDLSGLNVHVILDVYRIGERYEDPIGGTTREGGSE